MKYILASASPRRKELLEQAGFHFQVIPSSVEEKITKDAPSEIVMELASQKARDVYEHLKPLMSPSIRSARRTCVLMQRQGIP